MATWTNTYELNPQNFKNPGEGAFHLRDVKEAVRERGERDHFWGDDGGGDLGEDPTKDWYGGVHKEGSAKATVRDPGSALRGGVRALGSEVATGQIVMDMRLIGAVGNPKATKRKQDGTDLDEVLGYTKKDQLNKVIQAVGAELDSDAVPVDGADPTDVESYTVIDYDELVDIIQDQVIKGIKKFSTNPQVPEIPGTGTTLEERWKDYVEDNPPTTDATGLAAPNVHESYDLQQVAKLWNRFDPSEDANEPTTVDILAPSGKVVNETIEVLSVYGTLVKGTTVEGSVWG